MFGRLAADACAESLAFGPVAIDDEECSEVFLDYPGFISTDSGDQDSWHLGWWQLVTADGFTPLFHIFYRFNDVLTLNDRFSEATSGAGVDVTYEVWDAAMEVQLAHYDGATYHGASGAFETKNPFDATKVSIGFSDDDWCWGAKSGVVDCNAADLTNEATVAYGVAVANTDDGACAKLHNGSTTSTTDILEGQGVVTYLLYEHVNAPPTSAPTTFFCDFDGSAGVFALSLSALVCGFGAVLLALVARLGRCEEAKASFDQDYNLWLSGQQKANHELTEIERVRQMEFEVILLRLLATNRADCWIHSCFTVNLRSRFFQPFLLPSCPYLCITLLACLHCWVLHQVAQHRRRQEESALAAQRKDVANQAFTPEGLEHAERFAPLTTTSTATATVTAATTTTNTSTTTTATTTINAGCAGPSSSCGQKSEISHKRRLNDRFRKLKGRNHDDDNNDHHCYNDDGSAAELEQKAGLSNRVVQEGAQNGRAHVASVDSFSMGVGLVPAVVANYAAVKSISKGNETTGLVQQAPRSAFAPHELLPACCRWAPDSAGRYFSGPLSSLTIFAGSGPPILLFLTGAASLTFYYNGRSSDSNSIDKSTSGNSLPGVRCQPSLWYLPPLGVVLLCAAVAGVMLRAALMVFLPWLQRVLKQRYGSTLDYLRRRTHLLRFFATSKHCVMCLAQPASALAQPCCHLALCHACATPFRRSCPPRCVVCRKPCTYTKVVRSRRAHSEAATEEAWYQRAVNARDYVLNPVDYASQSVVELQHQVCQKKCFYKGAYLLSTSAVYSQSLYLIKARVCSSVITTVTSIRRRTA